MTSASAPPASTPRRLHPLLRFVRFGVLAYLGVILVMWLLENWLVYHPCPAARDWQNPPVPQIQDVEFESTDGTTIHAWWLPRPGARGALLYSHGNAGNLSHRGGGIVKLSQTLGVSVLIYDYPGYGKSEGRPTEAGCYAAGLAAYEWLTRTQGIDPKEIILYGGSLGGGVAVELASQKPHRAVVLAKTFTSLPDVGQSLYPWLPIRWLMRNQFDNRGKIGKCRNVFIGHGTRDQLVPFALGKQLFEAAPEPKEFFTFEDNDHNDRLPEGFFGALKQFLDRHPHRAPSVQSPSN